MPDQAIADAARAALLDKLDETPTLPRWRLAIIAQRAITDTLRRFHDAQLPAISQREIDTYDEVVETVDYIAAGTWRFRPRDGRPVCGCLVATPRLRLRGRYASIPDGGAELALGERFDVLLQEALGRGPEPESYYIGPVRITDERMPEAIVDAAIDDSITEATAS